MEKISSIEIQEKRDKHRLWLDSNEKEGAQANFSNSLLSIVNLREAKLARSKFTNASLKAVELVDADLSQADFSGAQLSKVDLHGAKLDETNFTRAIFKKVHIAQAEFDQIKSRLTEEQQKAVTTSYGAYMRKLLIGF